MAVEKTQEVLRNSDRVEGSEKSIPVNEEKKEEQEVAGGKKEAVEKADLKRKKMCEQSHDDCDLPDSTSEKSIPVNEEKKEEQEVAGGKKEAVEKADLKRKKMCEQSHDDSDLPDSTSGVGRLYATPTPGCILVDTPSFKKKLLRVSYSDVNPAADVTPDPTSVGKYWLATPKLAGLATMQTVTPMAGATPAPGFRVVQRTPDAINTLTNLWEKDIEERTRPLTDAELDAIFVLLNNGDVPEEIPDGLPFMEPKDDQFFASLLNKEGEVELSPDKQEERIIMKLLLELKNGTVHQMKTALRQLIVYAKEVDAWPLFKGIFKLFTQPELGEQQSHLLLKVINRIVYELDELVRPYVRKILVVIQDLLMAEDYNVRAEGTEIMYNLSKAAGLATMIDVMRCDIDNIDEYVRIATARSFGVVASALGITPLLPFLKEVCQSNKSWKACHTGLMIVNQIIIFNGCDVVPHSSSLVEIIKPGLKDEVGKVRTGATLALDALGEVAAPYGIEI